MAHVSAQAERSGCARSANRLRWQKVSTGAGVEYECVVRTSANVPRPESHRVPDGKVRHTRVRQAAVAMRALRLWHAASSAPSQDGRERDQQAWTHHFFTTNRCLESPPVSFSTSMSSSSAITNTRGRGRSRRSRLSASARRKKGQNHTTLRYVHTCVHIMVGTVCYRM